MRIHTIQDGKGKCEVVNIRRPMIVGKGIIVYQNLNHPSPPIARLVRVLPLQSLKSPQGERKYGSLLVRLFLCPELGYRVVRASRALNAYEAAVRYTQGAPTGQPPFANGTIQTRADDPRFNANISVTSDRRSLPKPDCGNVMPMRVDSSDKLWLVWRTNIVHSHYIPCTSDQVRL